MISTQVISTQHKTQVIDVTEQCDSMIGDIQYGIALFSVPHTTAALIICEDDEELRTDIVRVAENWLAGMRPFQHIKKNNPNAEAHILSAFAGTSLSVAIEDGKLLLGTYQNILLLEMDGPKNRNLHCIVIPAQS